MPGAMWVVAEVASDGSLAVIGTEIASLARDLAAAAGASVEGVIVAADPDRAAGELAAYVPRVRVVTEPRTADHAAPAIIAERVAALARAEQPALILTGAGPDGRDVAGSLMALLDWPVLANAVGVTWADGGLRVDVPIFGGSSVTTSGFTGQHGIVTVRPNVVTAAPADTAGSVEAVGIDEPLRLPAVAVRERVAAAGSAVAIEEAKIIVAGGRGVGGPDGFKLVEELATELGGAVGATRAAVDAGWIPYGQQIGQTGKIVKPQLYLALGISGAIQHKVGMQTAGTIVAVNRDADAPIAEFADLTVVGDLFQIGPAILRQLRDRAG